MIRRADVLLGAILVGLTVASAPASSAGCWQWDGTGSVTLQDSRASGAYLLLDSNMESDRLEPYLTFPAFALCQHDDDTAYQVRPLGIGQVNGQPVHFAYHCMGGQDLELMGESPRDVAVIIEAISAQQSIDIQVGIHQFHGISCNGREALTVASQRIDTE